MSGFPAPRYGTARTPGLRTVGSRVAVVGHTLGTPLLPWQQHVADVTGERHPDRPGWRYRTVIVTVPRQAGKTTLSRVIQVDRAVANRRWQVFYSAQTGKDARARWRELVAAVDESPVLGPHAETRRSQGTEALAFPNLSAIHPFTPNEKSLHGYTPHLIMQDEAWAFDAAEGATLEAAYYPAQQTLNERQMWIFSTRGDARAEWLDALIARGRESLTAPATDIAYFEWSADEDLAASDPVGDDTLAYHPALGHLVSLDDLRGEHARTSPGNWRRSYLNLPTVATRTLVKMPTWDALSEGEAQHGRDVVLGVAVAEARARAAIVAAWSDPEGTLHLAHVESGPGAAWIAESLRVLRTTLGPTRILANDTPATRGATADAVDEYVSARDYATASTALLGRIQDATLAHDGSAELRDHLEAAGLGNVAGGQAITEKASLGPVEAIQAAIVAAHAAPAAARSLQIF